MQDEDEELPPPPPPAITSPRPKRRAPQPPTSPPPPLVVIDEHLQVQESQEAVSPPPSPAPSSLPPLPDTPRTKAAVLLQCWADSAAQKLTCVCKPFAKLTRKEKNILLILLATLILVFVVGEFYIIKNYFFLEVSESNKHVM